MMVSNFITSFNNAYYDFLEGNMESAVAIFNKELNNTAQSEEKERFSRWIKYLKFDNQSQQKGENKTC
jgi:hypothetical protein